MPDALALMNITVDVGRGDAGRILDIPALDIPAGSRCGISGASGSGKTTLLHVLAGLLRPSSGRVIWGGTCLSEFSETARDRWRYDNVGLVFQDFQLVPELSAEANVLLPAGFFRQAGSHRDAARALLVEVGVPAQRRAALLSRGEQQRVAIARAILRAPSLLLADEPTASLDAANAELVSDLLIRSARAATLIVVTHDPALLARMHRVIRLDQGRVV